MFGVGGGGEGQGVICLGWGGKVVFYKLSMLAFDVKLQYHRCAVVQKCDYYFLSNQKATTIYLSL